MKRESTAASFCDSGDLTTPCLDHVILAGVTARPALAETWVYVSDMSQLKYQLTTRSLLCQQSYQRENYKSTSEFQSRYFSLALLFPCRHGASEFRTCIAPNLDKWLESR